MAAKKVEEEEVDESIRVMKNSLNNNKEDHYNNEETIYYKIPSSSMLMNVDMEGGLEPGAHRFIGAPSGGKTSATLDFMMNFLKKSNKELVRGVYYKAEGRLTPNMKARSGVKFVENVDEWTNGTCLVVDSNVFEFVFGNIRDLITTNKKKCKYFFVLDSLDMMAKRDDLKKPFEESGMVASGALLTSVFFKKVSIALAKRGHVAILISQVRDTIKINQYEKVNPKQGSASGGHAVEHAAGWVLDFLPRWVDDIIREGDEKTGKPIGHYAKCKIIKSDNESYLREIRYPICYGRTNGNSVWKEKEVLDVMVAWEFVARPSGKGAWYQVSEELSLELKEAGFEVEESYQGLGKVSKWLESNPDMIQYLANKFQALI